ncbi:MAG: dephospho-CoA kinase, partial [Victivallales bacterium]|nr:dephospho-CoA kinase [Victivallales bacterium]
MFSEHRCLSSRHSRATGRGSDQSILVVMPLVVITGGIGTGKSTVLDAFAKLGANCLDTDEVAHALYAPGAPAWQPIREH